ncbi:putative major capsid protein [Caudoviricetes sp.]|nr:putative major capsid protein [Caudoviricetes sp.]
MSVNLTTNYVRQYSTNVALLLQQKGSKLRSAVMGGSHVGSQASPVDQIGAVTATRVTTRFADMPRTDAPTDRRWCFPVDYDLAQLIDSFDKLRLVIDPQSAYVQNAVMALGREMDDEIISAMFGTAYTGVNGSTSTSFLAGNVVGVNTGGTDSGLNVNKLRAGKKLLMSHEVDFDNDPVYCAITSKEHDELLNEIQVISSDFNGADRPVLQEGKVQRFLGINFIHCERLATEAAGTDDQSGSSTQIPMWAKSGLYLGLWDDINVKISQRDDLQSIPWQVYTKATFGATRLEEKKVVKIWCQA